MPMDMYEDQGPDQAAAATSVRDEPETVPEGEDDEKSSSTTLINSEICPGLKVGDTLELRITGVHEGEYSVEYESMESEGEETSEGEEEGEGEGGYGGPPTAEGSEGGIGKYME